jgi:hypothetical protein
MTSIEKAKKIVENEGRCSELECSDYLQGSDTDCPCYKACTKTDSDMISPLSVQICKDFLLAQASEDAVKLPLYSEHDPVNKPDHYTANGVQCWDTIKASMTPEAFCGYLKGNVQKYIWRYEKKVAPVGDLRKALAYLTKLIEEVEGGSVRTEK